LTALSFACQRWRTVCRSTVNFPFRLFPQLLREPENVEGLRLPVAPRAPVGRREAPKLEPPRLGGMQRQPESREPLAQLGEVSAVV